MMKHRAEGQGWANTRLPFTAGPLPALAAGPSWAGFRWRCFWVLYMPHPGRRTYTAEKLERGKHDECEYSLNLTVEHLKMYVLCSSRCRIRSDCEV